LVPQYRPESTDASAVARAVEGFRELPSIHQRSPAGVRERPFELLRGRARREIHKRPRGRSDGDPVFQPAVTPVKLLDAMHSDSGS
jgi:hypothetical protein